MNEFVERTTLWKRHRKDVLKPSLIIFVLSLVFIQQSIAGMKTARERAELLGSVRTVVEEAGTWENGSEVSSKSTTYGANGDAIESVESYYNVGNHVVQVRLKTIYSYDHQKNKEESISSHEDGSISFKTVNTYNADGKLSESANYGPRGSLAFTFVHRYDDNKNNIETISYKPDGSIYARYVKTYDDKAHLKKETAYKADKSIDYKVLYMNDEKGRMTESAIYKPDGSLEDKRTYVYDQKGYESEMARYRANGSLREKENYAYEFDSVGNWIKKTTKKWESKEAKLEILPPYIAKRTITY